MPMRVLVVVIDEGCVAVLGKVAASHAPKKQV